MRLPFFFLVEAKFGVSLQSAIKREISSVGLEHLPYKQGVNGSNPLSPTENDRPGGSSGAVALFI